ncbi:hypothetical protein Mal48_37340 [Thalassoglobus polymorphus]|uniref:Uncharacterized protein n=1 Tax=Thalassoglobus polymorphus TaxID=2527994 RepID=A0A517QS72_9PLAN|nr:hypothetical protein Mal48_37340 [Thalassoglobus polymorphus]
MHQILASFCSLLILLTGFPLFGVETELSCIDGASAAHATSDTETGSCCSNDAGGCTSSCCASAFKSILTGFTSNRASQECCAVVLHDAAPHHSTTKNTALSDLTLNVSTPRDTSLQNLQHPESSDSPQTPESSSECPCSTGDCCCSTSTSISFLETQSSLTATIVISQIDLDSDALQSRGEHPSPPPPRV